MSERTRTYSSLGRPTASRRSRLETPQSSVDLSHSTRQYRANRSNTRSQKRTMRETDSRGMHRHSSGASSNTSFRTRFANTRAMRQHTTRMYATNAHTNSRAAFVPAYDAYGSAAPVYQPDYEAQPNSRKPKVKLVKGQKKNNKHLKTLPSFVPLIFKALIALILIIALVSIVRVWVSINIVNQLEQVQTVSNQVDDARTLSNNLEVQHSQLASTSRIQSEAQAAGMSYSKAGEHITVSIPASIATNQDGNISIAGTVKNIEASAGA